MKRRDFIQQAGAVGMGTMFLPTDVPPLFKTMKMGVVVHSYAFRWQSKFDSVKFPPFTDVVMLMDHCAGIGAGGVQVLVKDWSADFAKKVRAKREQLGLFLEGSIAVPSGQNDISRFEREVTAAKEAGANVLRTVTSSGRRYEAYHSKEEVELFKKKAMASLRLAEPVLKKHRVKLAVENHKDWRADELVDAMKQLQSEWIGVTLDFGNSISLLEDPLMVVEQLSPYVMSTHVKDMGVAEYEDGFLLSELPLGKGILELDKMFALCRRHNPAVTFSLEMITRDPLQIPCLKDEYWKSFEGVPATALASALRMVKQKRSDSLPRVSSLSSEEKLLEEEKNILECFAYTRDKVILNTI
jgi:sugar phosphate isomerase/epimerase